MVTNNMETTMFRKTIIAFLENILFVHLKQPFPGETEDWVSIEPEGKYEDIPSALEVGRSTFVVWIISYHNLASRYIVDVTAPKKIPVFCGDRLSGAPDMNIHLEVQVL